MLVSCAFCGGTHTRGNRCAKRIQPKRQKESNYITRFRSSNIWQRKRKEIKKRDRELCQVCLTGKYQTTRKYNFQNLEVHHIQPISSNWEKRLNMGNLITLCAWHHKMADNGIINSAELIDLIRTD